MKPFLDEDFLLENDFSKKLYFDHAAGMPIIDYHNHLSPAFIATDHSFENITEAWLSGDHYKWRAMRANGIDEEFITGKADDKSKFLKWAETVPYTMRNPLYHWTHLELQRYFNINELLNQKTGPSIYERTNSMLCTEKYSTLGLLAKMNVEVLCTTDDPVDELEFHKEFQKQDQKLKMLPGFRPDKYFAIEGATYLESIEKLEYASDRSITHFHDLIAALQDRIHFFHNAGCRLSDHGLTQIFSADFTDEEVERIFIKRMSGKKLFPGEALQYRSAVLYYLARLYHSMGWTMQFHLGALRDNNRRLQKLYGSDAGCDSIGDFTQAESLAKFLGLLDEEEKLCKTIIYNLNPRDNEVFASMAGNFNDGNIAAKIQWGSAWWFLDQKDGIEDQLNVLSNMGLLSRFIGMLTDSRSFLSFPRHEYFRRILCNMIGKDVEKGALPDDLEWLGEMVTSICYKNAKRYFEF